MNSVGDGWRLFLDFDVWIRREPRRRIPPYKRPGSHRHWPALYICERATTFSAATNSPELTRIEMLDSPTHCAAWQADVSPCPISTGNHSWKSFGHVLDSLEDRWRSLHHSGIEVVQQAIQIACQLRHVFADFLSINTSGGAAGGNMNQIATKPIEPKNKIEGSRIDRLAIGLFDVVPLMQTFRIFFFARQHNYSLQKRWRPLGRICPRSGTGGGLISDSWQFSGYAALSASLAAEILPADLTPRWVRSRQGGE